MIYNKKVFIENRGYSKLLNLVDITNMLFKEVLAEIWFNPKRL